MTNETLGDALPKEMARVRELKAIYLSLPFGAGRPGAFLMEQSLEAADRASISGDVIAMLRAYRDLQEYTE